MGACKLFCRRCHVGVVVNGDLPSECPHCRSTTWSSAIDPRVRYQLSADDKRFLRSNRIAIDDPPDAHLGAAEPDDTA